VRHNLRCAFTCSRGGDGQNMPRCGRYDRDKVLGLSIWNITERDVIAVGIVPDNLRGECSCFAYAHPARIAFQWRRRFQQRLTLCLRIRMALALRRPRWRRSGLTFPALVKRLASGFAYSIKSFCKPPTRVLAAHISPKLYPPEW